VLGSLVPNRAETMTVATPVGIKAASDLALRPYACAWRRVCWGGPDYCGYGGPIMVVRTTAARTGVPIAV